MKNLAAPQKSDAFERRVGQAVEDKTCYVGYLAGVKPFGGFEFFLFAPSVEGLEDAMRAAGFVGLDRDAVQHVAVFKADSLTPARSQGDESE